ncbi:MAG: radical SAM protein [Thermoplasmata archaeon]
MACTRAGPTSLDGGIATSYKVVLTADKTLMSSYNQSMFIGFAACFPRVLPRWLYTRLFCPSQPHPNGLAKFAPCGLRKIQAALIRSGIPEKDIAVAYPDSIHRVVDEKTKVIGINTSDPMGLGPASSTFSSLIGKEPYTAFFFRTLVTNEAIRRSGAKVIVGGAGAWQLGDEAIRERLGIDTLVEGEGELVAPQLFKDALEGRPLPKKVTGGTTPVEEIPLIAGPTINGMVEISRGCGRGCEFCNPNMRTIRHLPEERILEEVKLNLASGTEKTCLHAEDVLRYKAKGMVPDAEKVVGLFERVAKLTGNIGMSHFALSSALAAPKLVEELSHIVGADSGRKVYGQTGIETGSPKLVRAHMKGKAKPFEPERWPEVVRESFKLLADNNWVPCGTLVMGMPGERAEDVSRTLELVRDLRQYKSLIVPLFFVPLGELKESEFFRPNAMLPEHWMLLAECIEHDFSWVRVLMEELFAQNRLSSAKANGMKLAAWYMQRRLKPSLELMREGKNPLAVEREQPQMGLYWLPPGEAEA